MADDDSATHTPLQVTLDQRGHVTIFRLGGDLDNRTLDSAKAAVQKTLDEGHLQLLMDLAQVRYVDSAGLGFFIGTLKRVREAGGELKLLNLNAYMLGIFRLISLDYVLDLHDDLDRALGSFGPPPAGTQPQTETNP